MEERFYSIDEDTVIDLSKVSLIKRLKTRKGNYAIHFVLVSGEYWYNAPSKAERDKIFVELKLMLKRSIYNKL